MSQLQSIAEAVISGKSPEVQRLIKEALEAGTKPVKIINDGLIAGMQVIADRFKRNEIYVPEVLIAARAMNAGLTIVKPLISDTDMKPIAKVIIGTVKGDLHDIGKKLVAMMLEGAGFEVIDLGIDVSPEKFIEAVKENHPQIMAMSALLTTTMPAMAESIKLLEESGLRNQVKVIIGGAPITDAYAQKIGADGYSPDAGSAVDLAKSLVS
ncbi:MAG TPA: cobalamin-binding protein [Firmicutes bacterium]|nr:cobalamin-binding protein [Bacillota bacterium]